MIRDTLIQYIQQALKNIGVAESDLGLFAIEHPDELSHGDYSTNVALVYAKKLGMKPRELAEKIVTEIKKVKSDKNLVSFGGVIEKIDIAGPGFVNFHLAPVFFNESISTILAQGNRFGSSNTGRGKTVLVEYSSPNIAKPFTVGHLRSTVIGDAIANILAFSGYKVIRDNHLGDWGTQFGKQIVAVKKWGSLAELDKSDNKMKYLVDLYVKFHAEAETNPSLEDEGRAAFAALENGDKDAQALYEKIVAISMKYFAAIYARLKVSPFDTQHGEHFYEKYIAPVIADLEKAKLLEESDGAKLVFFREPGQTMKDKEGKEVPKEKYPPLMIQKKDGTTLYATRDLATDKFRRETYGPDITVVNEVGVEQALHFKQLFEVEDRLSETQLGYFKKSQRVHVAHGFYRFEDGKMSTRKGNAIWLEDIINESIKRAGAINPDTADAVGIGAIKFNDLKRESIQDIIFSWDEMLNLTGDSCPYLQYSHARALSILEKAKAQGIVPAISKDADSVGTPGTLTTLEKLLYRFPEVVERAAKEYQPHHIATYLLTVAAAFSTFYGSTQIVKKDDPQSPYRAAVTVAFAIVVKNGLTLLGIAAPEKM
jgi:arginyl-tRNA synthetase